MISEWIDALIGFYSIVVLIKKYDIRGKVKLVIVVTTTSNLS
jgi:hypothetical protein